MTSQIINPSAIAAPAGMYSHGVLAPSTGQWLYVSGQIGMRPDGSLGTGFAARLLPPNEIQPIVPPTPLTKDRWIIKCPIRNSGGRLSNVAQAEPMALAKGSTYAMLCSLLMRAATPSASAVGSRLSTALS